MKKTTVVLLFLSLFCFAGAQKKVAVVKPYLEGNASAIHTNLVKQTLVSTILKVEGYSAFSRNEIDAIFTEQSFQYGGDVNDATRKKLGDMYGADLLCISQIVGSGGEILMSAMLIDVQTAEIVASPEPVVVKATTQNVQTAAKNIAEQLLGVEVIADMPKVAGANAKKTSKATQRQSVEYNNPANTTQLQGTDVFVSDYDEYGEFNWSDANQICASKGMGWRLPTAQELIMIMANRVDDKTHKGIFTNFKGWWYWSSTRADNGKEYINVSTGGSDSGEKPKSKQAVRCVWCMQ